jgi:uncharacterized membrane protein
MPPLRVRTSIPVMTAAPARLAPLPTRPHPGRRAGWLIMTCGAVLVGGYAVALVVSGFRLVPAEIAANRFPTPLGLRVHIVAAGVALLTGPFQFARALRQQLPRVHRALGRTYVLACAAGAASGGAIALFSASGVVAGAGFLALALGWAGATAIGVAAIRAGEVARHRRWMIRSFALTYAAVMLRLYLPLTGLAGISFERAYPAIAWLCWLPNLLVAQLLTDRGSSGTSRAEQPPH